VQLLKEAAPGIARIGYLRDAGSPSNATGLAEAMAAAQAGGVTLRTLEVGSLTEAERALARMSSEPGGALVVASLFAMTIADEITKLAAKYRLPALYGARVCMDSGGLMYYGPSLPDLWRRAAIYVDRILKGVTPADLPVEQPTKYDLAINLQTANALGLTIPPSLLARADRVIE